MTTYPTPPKASARAFNALRGRFGDTQFSRVWGCWRYIDIIIQTGHQCDNRKLRELVEFDRHLVCREDWIIDGRKFRVFWLNPDYPNAPVGLDLDQGKNPPARQPHDVRLVPRRVTGYAPVVPGKDTLFEICLPRGEK